MLAGAETPQGGQAGSEGLLPASEGDRGIGAQGIGVHGVDEDRVGLRPGQGHLAVGALPQPGPQAGLHEGVADLPGAQVLRPPAAHIEGLLAHPVVELDDHGQEPALLAAVHADDPAGSGRGEAQAGPPLVLEQQLPGADAVTLLHGHGRPQVVVVRTDEGHPRRGPRVLHDLPALARDRQIEALADGEGAVLTHRSGSGVRRGVESGGVETRPGGPDVEGGRSPDADATGGSTRLAVGDPWRRDGKRTRRKLRRRAPRSGACDIVVELS